MIYPVPVKKVGAASRQSSGVVISCRSLRYDLCHRFFSLGLISLRLNNGHLKSKGLLFVGILMLVLGIILKNFMGWFTVGIILILSGIVCKTVYIIVKARTGEYNPGGELYFLFIGLTLFLAGLVLKSYYTGSLPKAMIIFGLALKIVFIIKFIMIVRSNRELSGK